MFGRFQLAGNRPGAVRSDAEMCALNKSAADLAFKTQKKILDRYLAERNFLKYQTGSYIRRNPLDQPADAVIRENARVFRLPQKLFR